MMNRQEAIDFIVEIANKLDNKGLHEKATELMEALAALTTKPTPDPGTGLVPCGCGGKLELRTRTFQYGRNNSDKYQYWVICRKCHWSTMDYLSKELAIQHANQAMGHKGVKTL